MTAVKLDKFGGEIPRLGARLLPEDGAQAAINTKLFSGELRSWYRLKEVALPLKGTGGTLKSMYRIYTTTGTNEWLSWTDDVDAVRGPIAGDTAFKLYYTGDTTTATNSTAGPRKTTWSLAISGTSGYPGDYLEMGVPAPGAAPVVIGTGGTATTSVTRVYCYTYVTQTATWDEEGPPSPLGTGTGKTDAVWPISALSTGTTGKYAFSAGVKRIYRALTDSAGNTNYQLALDNVAMGTSSASDNVADADLGVICPSFTPGVVNSEWVAPPSTMKGLIALPNGIMAGFSGNEVCFSEPFYPHAWPIRYRLTTNFDIVSLGRFGQTLIVTTKGNPYAITGSRPDSMAMTMIQEVHPCTSKRGTVSFPFGVMFPTPDGLVLVGVGGTINVVEDYMKRDEWRNNCYPDTLLAAQFQSVFFGFFNTGTVDKNVVFDKAAGNRALTFGNIGAQGVWTDPETGRLYILQNNTIWQWDTDTNNLTPYDWRSKTFVFPKPVNFGAAQIEADFASFDDGAAISSASAADLVVNNRILGTSSGDYGQLAAWAATAAYTTSTGSGAAASIVRSSNGNYMAICVVSGTSSSVEPTWPTSLGGSATDGTVQWKRIHEVDGRSKGSLRGQILRGYTQRTSTDPLIDGTAGGNQWGFPLRGSLLVGGVYPNYDDRYLRFMVYAISTSTDSTMSLVSSQDITSRSAIRLPRGYKSDSFEFRIVGNVAVRLFKVAETMKELATV